jgi:hypothetical protein
MIPDANKVHPYGSFWLDFADKLIKGLAVIVAGAWTLINFKRSRVFHRKLEPSVSGEIFESGGEYYILVQTRLKNVGQSRYIITQKGTGLEAIKLSTQPRERISVTPIFENHAWIEPGEQIEDPVILKIPPPSAFVAVKLTLRVVSRTPEPTEWNCSCIVRDIKDKTS